LGSKSRRDCYEERTSDLPRRDRRRRKYRPRAAKITTIVFVPIKYKFVNDKDAIAY